MNYDELRVPRLVNAAGTLTRLGGSLMDLEVTASMADAARSFVRMDGLHAAAGRQIAAATGAEAGLVTAGAAASLTLAAAACLARDDLAIMDRLPDTVGLPNEIIIPRSHRNGYDHALRAAGARLVEVGVAERTRDPQPWEIAAWSAWLEARGPDSDAETLADFAELRCHFHVPLFADFTGPLTTTRANVAPAVKYALEKGLTTNFIAETYTWNVLANLAQSGNAAARALVGSDGTVDVNAGIVNELKWCRELL